MIKQIALCITGTLSGCFYSCYRKNLIPDIQIIIVVIAVGFCLGVMSDFFYKKYVK